MLAAHTGLEELFSDLSRLGRDSGDYRLCAATWYSKFGVIFREKGHLKAVAYKPMKRLMRSKIR